MMEETYKMLGCKQEGGTSHNDSGTNEDQTTEKTKLFFHLPAEALFYALPYMSLKELLSMERVCRASREWVKNGVLLWHRLHVETPLSIGLMDEALFQLSNRANGELECLCLVDCLGVTEKAVEQVVIRSPRLTKLFLPGCSGISADGFVNIVKLHTEKWGATMPGLKELKIRNIRGLTKSHLQSLFAIMGTQGLSDPVPKLCFYNKYLPQSCNSLRKTIDVDECPKCGDIRMVYDCTRKECQATQACRACEFCTVRCAECGICLQDDEQNETRCFHHVCLDCWLKLPKCSECNKPTCQRHLGDFMEVSQSGYLCRQCIESPSMPCDLEYDL